MIHISLGENKKEQPILRIIEKTEEGELIGHRNILLTTGFGVFKANQFLRSLNTGLEVKFESFSQYYRLINDINNCLKEVIK